MPPGVGAGSPAAAAPARTTSNSASIVRKLAALRQAAATVAIHMDTRYSSHSGDTSCSGAGYRNTPPPSPPGLPPGLGGRTSGTREIAPSLSGDSASPAGHVRHRLIQSAMDRHTRPCTTLAQGDFCDLACSAPHVRDAAGEQRTLAIAEGHRRRHGNARDTTQPATDYTDEEWHGHSAIWAEPDGGTQQFLAGIARAEDVRWKRPHELGASAARVVVFADGIEPEDIKQGQVGDCYFLAALAACVSGEDDHLLRDLIVEDAADIGGKMSPCAGTQPGSCWRACERACVRACVAGF
jgi:hypothetical protein